MVNERQLARLKPTVFVVDDDRAVRDSLSFILGLDGFPVRTYAAGEDLINEPDLPEHGCLLIDDMMPGMSGLQVIDALRHRGTLTPAILIVSRPTSKVRTSANTRGIRVLEKPFLEHALVEAIESATARA